MNASRGFPSFDVLLPEFNQFILELVEDHHAGKINSWEKLEEKVNVFFTPEQNGTCRIDHASLAQDGFLCRRTHPCSRDVRVHGAIYDA